ncbi:NAD-dependent epimerase/dehydratase family protein [Candidatus Rhabdochlamydia sp. T3358]|uniref:NAD-dependent epimerase/dehydratase family protein n=1 Tax=Candidatus Rhabdochlamydia sp. T3358 TaxID=2099795 RepID=UPI0010B24EBF|nr:NAD-dependent epimerase/dehydratase family protein [Candidatus Rhabdochlamydia sp. T3358]VHO03913.1 GDP-L-fucose synthase [Candidatus Rhabdochlamydia sp. T3358]
MKKALVLGAGGFIGSALVRRLKKEGYWVRGSDLKYPEFSETEADEFLICDLRNFESTGIVFTTVGDFDEVYQLAADMGGATYINGGENDANVVSNSVLINVNVAKLCVATNVKILFFPSSACVYSSYKDHATCIESEVYPAFPDNEYGWEKLFSERMYHSYHKNLGLNVKIARFHSIIGPESQWKGGKEKAHSALARKVAMVNDGGVIDVIRDGTQTRTFLYIEDCLDAVRLLVNSDVTEPVNIGSDHLISIKDYVLLLQSISKKNFTINFVDGPTGVKERECSVEKITKLLGWRPKIDLQEATEKTYYWIQAQLEKRI